MYKELGRGPSLTHDILTCTHKHQSDLMSRFSESEAIPTEHLQLACESNPSAAQHHNGAHQKGKDLCHRFASFWCGARSGPKRSAPCEFEVQELPAVFGGRVSQAEEKIKNEARVPQYSVVFFCNFPKTYRRRGPERVHIPVSPGPKWGDALVKFSGPSASSLPRRAACEV